jgi:hypothetical protein
MVKLLLHNFINVSRLFPSAAGLAGFLAQLFHPPAGAPGRLEFGLVPFRGNGIAAGYLADSLFQFFDSLSLFLD